MRPDVVTWFVPTTDGWHRVAVGETHHDSISLNMIGQSRMPERGGHVEQVILLTSKKFGLTAFSPEITLKVARTHLTRGLCRRASSRWCPRGLLEMVRVGVNEGGTFLNPNISHQQEEDKSLHTLSRTARFATRKSSW